MKNIDKASMSQFLPYIHNLRGIAILFVVGVHARGGVADWISHPDANRFVQVIFDAQEGNGTVMFVFISGFLFRHLTQQGFAFRKYLEKKFKVIILPYIIISVPIILIRISTPFESPALTPDFFERPVLYQFFHHLLTGSHMAPFWFINMIILMYLSTPLFHALDTPFFYRYIFPFVLIAGLFTYRPEHNGNPILAYLHSIPVYLLGMWTCFNREKILSASSILLWPLIVLYIIISALDLTDQMVRVGSMTFEKVLAGEGLLFNFYYFRTMIVCFICMIVLYLLRDRKMLYVGLLGDYSFGIFFIHFILIIVTRKLLSMLLIPIDFSVITFLIYFVFILLASVVTVFCVKKLTGRYSRNLIGS